MSVAGPRSFVSTGRYVPAELAPSQRPGAMDAFKLCSLQGGRRVVHRTPSLELAKAIHQPIDGGSRWK